MIEDELRAAFARHEELAPDPVGVREGIGVGIARRRRRRRLAQLIGAAALVIGVAAVPGVIRWLGPGSAAPPADQSASPATGRALNLLVLGIDRRPGSGPASRADTVMIAHLPKSGDKGYLVAIPRDTFVDIPGHGQDKINAAYAYGGGELAASVVENVTGVKLDGTLTVDFAGLVSVTDAVGGVEMCPRTEIRSYHSGRVFPAGCQHVTGEQALDLLRQRMYLPGGELDRVDTGQEYLRALFARLSDAKLLANPTRLLELVSAAGDGVKLDLGGADPREWISLIRVSPGDLLGLTVPVTEVNSSGRSGLELTGPEASQLFAALRTDQMASWAAANQGRIRRR